MKYLKSAFCVLVVGMGASSLTHAQTAKFNHSGVQVGKIIETCYHDPCAGAKVTSFKQLHKTNNSAMLELTLLGYSRYWNSKKKDWNKQSHKIFVNCSVINPTITNGGQVTHLPINPEMGIPGVLQSSYGVYVSACHGGYMDETKLAKKFGYNVTDW